MVVFLASSPSSVSHFRDIVFRRSLEEPRRLLQFMDCIFGWIPLQSGLVGPVNVAVPLDDQGLLEIALVNETSICLIVVSNEQFSQCRALYGVVTFNLRARLL